MRNMDMVKLELIKQVNDVRVSKGLERLKHADSLDYSAYLRAIELCSNGRLEHDDWISTLDSVYSFDSAGESLAVGYTNAKDLVDAWVDSPEHYLNIVDRHFSETGGAVVECGGEIYVVQHYAEPYEEQLIVGGFNSWLPVLAIIIGVMVCSFVLFYRRGA